MYYISLPLFTSRKVECRSRMYNISLFTMFATLRNKSRAATQMFTPDAQIHIVTLEKIIKVKQN